MKLELEILGYLGNLIQILKAENKRIDITLYCKFLTVEVRNILSDFSKVR